MACAFDGAAGPVAQKPGGGCELGVHEPAVPTAKLIGDALEMPLAHLYCEDDGTAALLLALHQLPMKERVECVHQFAQVLAEGAV